MNEREMLEKIVELWKPIYGYDDQYRISSLGRVFSVKSDIYLKYLKSHNGYRLVNLFKDGVGKMHRVNRLVAEAFLPNWENKKTVNHINGEKTDNRVENLEWCTHGENKIHAFRVLKLKPYSKPVVQKTMSGEFVAEFESMSDASRSLRINNGSIWCACNGRYKQAGGYKFEYKTEER